MFFKNLRTFLATKARFDELTAGGMEPHDAGDQIASEAQAKGLDPATIAAILAFIMQLIQMFVKK